MSDAPSPNSHANPGPPPSTTPPGQAGGGPPYPSQPFAPNPYASKSRRGLSRGALIGIIAGAVVLLVVIVTVAGIGITSAIRGSQAEPESAVQDYLTALQNGDAKQALALLEDPDDTAFLNDDVLKASNKLAKIGTVSTTSKPFGAPFTKVKAKFSIGSERVTQEFVVKDQGDGTYTIFQGGTVSVSSYNLSDAPVTLNGQDVSDAAGDSWTLFPGTYSFAVSLDSFSVTGGDSIILAGDESGSLDDVKVALNDTGVQQFRDAVTDAVNTCIASTTLAAGCGLDLPGTLSDGTVVQDGTLTRSLSADAQANLSNLEPQETFGDPLNVPGEYIGLVTVTSTSCTQGGAAGACTIEFGPTLGSPQVDFTSGTPVVRWD